MSEWEGEEDRIDSRVVECNLVNSLRVAFFFFAHSHRLRLMRPGVPNTSYSPTHSLTSKPPRVTVSQILSRNSCLTTVVLRQFTFSLLSSRLSFLSQVCVYRATCSSLSNKDECKQPRCQMPLTLHVIADHIIFLDWNHCGLHHQLDGSCRWLVSHVVGCDRPGDSLCFSANVAQKVVQEHVRLGSSWSLGCLGERSFPLCLVLLHPGRVN